MNSRSPFLFIVGLLLIGGIATAAFRNTTYRVPFLPGAAQSVWLIEARIEFDAEGGPVQVDLTLPPAQNDFRFGAENTASPDYGFLIEQISSQRVANWSRRSADGEQTLFYKLEAIADDGYRVPTRAPVTPAAVDWDEPYLTAVASLLDDTLPQSADGYTLARQLLLRMRTEPLGQNAALLLDEWPLTQLLPRMLVSSGVPAAPCPHWTCRISDDARRCGSWWRSGTARPGA